MTKTSYQFQIQGTWMNPDVAKIRSFFRDHVLNFVETKSTPYLSVTKGEVVTEVVLFDSPDEWLSGLARDLKSASFSCVSAGRSVQFSWNLPKQLSFSSTGDEGNRDAACALIEAARGVFQLAPREEVGRRRYSLSGTYRRARVPDVLWLDDAIALLQRFHTGGCSASFRLASSPQIRRNSDVIELHERMHSGEPLLDWSINCGSANILYNATNDSVSVNASSESETEVLDLMSDLQKRLVLEPAGERPDEQKTAVTRRAFMKRPPAVEWFDRAIEALPEITEGNKSTMGNLRTVDDEEMTFPTQSQWRSEIQARWSQLSKVRFWRAGPAGSINVDVDLLRGLVTYTFNLSIRNESRLRDFAGLFELATDLEPAPRNVYKYRKYGLSYHIERWGSTRQYGAAIANGVLGAKGAFAGRPVAVMSAYVETGEKPLSLSHFESVEKFVAWFQPDGEFDKEFERASLVVEGFGGTHLGIHVDRKEEKFTIRGNLDNLQAFSDVDKLFSNAMIRGDKKDTADQTSTGSTELWKVYLAAAVSVIVAVIAAAGSIMLNAHREQATLKIIYPADKAELKGSSVDVQWTYLMPRVFGRPYEPAIPVGVQLLPDGKEPLPMTNAFGHKEIKNLEPGTYTIIVSVPDGLKDSRQFTVGPQAVRAQH